MIVCLFWPSACWPACLPLWFPPQIGCQLAHRVHLMWLDWKQDVQTGERRLRRQRGGAKECSGSQTGDLLLSSAAPEHRRLPGCGDPRHRDPGQAFSLLLSLLLSFLFIGLSVFPSSCRFLWFTDTLLDSQAESSSYLVSPITASNFYNQF